MKKIVFLCIGIFVNLYVMAQNDLNDNNWEVVFSDGFSDTGRSWDYYWISSPDKKWRSFIGYNSITHGSDERQIYQYTNCHFNSQDGTMELVSEFDWANDIPNHNYFLPPSMGNNFPSESQLYFFSGYLEAKKDSIYENDMKFGFGYFEIRCKLPTHHGAFPAFWLFGNGTNTYEEIDIFEHIATDVYSPREYTIGLWHNPNGSNYLQDRTTSGATKYKDETIYIPNSEQDLNHYHVFSCEWMPDYVRWYRDGQLVSEYTDETHISKYKKTLIINYALNQYSYNIDNVGPNGWSGTDIMTIDYVKAYQLRLDCNTDEFIATSTQFANFDYKVKKTITIGSSNNAVVVPSNTNVSMRAVDYILINGEFELPASSQMTLQTHRCMECLDNN
jgi:hypothetical protein